MSRTYRNSRIHRWKHRGKTGTFTSYHKIITKNKSFSSINGDIQIQEPSRNYGARIALSGDSIKAKICDVDNPNYIPSSIKKMCRRIDRARYKDALRRNSDAFIRPKFDPWDWD
jgi:hypothetical protein